ncbi:MAG: hypothetical protein LQ340_004071 [Diploschistes diacapsis]|nr:MAG: hypothetical protein LQ340_004071 [Diploschistes diacapsis]
MSNNDNPSEPSTPAAPLSSTRRASIAPGQRLSELFGRSATSNNASAGSQAYPGPIAAAAANAQANQKRRMSISTLGLSGSPSQTSPFSGVRARHDSSSSNGSGSPTNDSAIDESGDGAAQPSTSPFGRRLSFGARAMREVRGGKGGSMNGRASISSTITTNSSPRPSPLSLPPTKGARGLSSSLEEGGEADMPSSNFPITKSSNFLNRRVGEAGGFNWSDQLRSRAQRSSSITGPTVPSQVPHHHKSATVTSAEMPPSQMPKPTQTPPDYFQERILKGDFYMD